ncbi:cystatin-F [Cololabis saira]|uniref:cystatin-F n=1 Tax=Cololabis saira TaxID=129043 RepID=UPI002AD3D0BE|nr:cystatin-F [Cololabis saira]
MEVKTLLMIVLITALDVAAAAVGGSHRSAPGSWSNVSGDDPGLRRVVITAASSFNSRSNDAFLFRPAAVHRARRQIVKGVLYVVDLDISRTVCRKRDDDNDLTRCEFQPPGRLHQTFQCHAEVWTIPWREESKTLEMQCKP